MFTTLSLQIDTTLHARLKAHLSRHGDPMAYDEALSKAIAFWLTAPGGAQPSGARGYVCHLAGRILGRADVALAVLQGTDPRVCPFSPLACALAGGVPGGKHVALAQAVEHQVGHFAPAHQMLVDDAGGGRRVHPVIPHAVRIDDHDRALVAAGQHAVGATAFDAQFRARVDQRTELSKHRLRGDAVLGAARPHAHQDVALMRFHGAPRRLARLLSIRWCPLLAAHVRARAASIAAARY
jgi:hypothetical protein